MSTITILDSDARPQPLSPLFTRLPVELRLMIYTFVFVGCQASFGLKIKFPWLWHPRDAGDPESWFCHYYHTEGGFGILLTCRMAYIEAFNTYWSEAVLSVDWVGSLQECCGYLPAAIKANLRHIRGARLPIADNFPGRVEDPYHVPAQFAQLPKLISCAFWTSEIWGREIWTESYLAGYQHTPGEYWLKVPDTEIRSQGYEGVGPFHLKSGESPAAYIERTIGVRVTDGVTILSYGWGLQGDDCPRDFKPREQFLNWTTGMVYQTTSDLRPLGSTAEEDDYGTTAEEDAYQQAMRAKPGDEWSRSYYVLD